MVSNTKTSASFSILLSGVIAFSISFFGLLSSIEVSYYDKLLQNNLLSYPDDIIIVAIDEASIERLGAWPWDRHHHAKLVERLAEASVIVFDVIFAESQSSLVNTLQQDASADTHFSQAIKNNKKVVLPLHIEQIRFQGELIEVLPLEIFSRHAQALGHAHVDYTSRGVARGIYLYEGLGGPVWPHLSVAVAEFLDELPDQMPGVRSQHLNFAANEIYRDHFNRLKFFGTPGSVYRISYIDLLEGRVPKELLVNKRVFVGATATGLGDEVPTPLGAFAGVEFNASAYHAIRSNGYIDSPAVLTHAIISALIVILITLLLSRLSPALFFLFTFVLILLVSMAVALSFLLIDFWFSPVAIIFGMVLFFPLWSWRRIEMALFYLQQELIQLKYTQKKISLSKDDISYRLNSLIRVGMIDSWEIENPLLKKVNAWPEYKYKDNILHTNFLIDQASYRLTVHSLSGESKIISILESVLSELDSNNLEKASSYELVEKTIDEIYLLKDMAEKSRIRMDRSMAELEDAILVADASGIIIFSNRKVEDFFQRSMLGQSIVDLKATIKAYDWLSILRNLMVDEEGIYQEIKLDGDRCFLCQATVIKDDSPLVDTYIFVFTDVTQLRNLERTKNEALAFLSHDMRSPIVSLLALLESYRINNFDDDNKLSSAFIDNIELCARKNLKYSEDFLQLTRAENISQEVFNLIDMHGLIDGAYSQVFGFASNKGVFIKIDRVDDDCWMLGDAHLLERAIANILLNSVKYSPKGAEVKVRLSLNRGVQLEIEDEGLGIPKESIPYLFEPYFRVKDKQKKLSALNVGVSSNVEDSNYGAKSYGLGLSFVYTVISRHGGTIHVQSELDVGSQFIMNFPLHSIG